MSDEMLVDTGAGRERRIPVNYPSNSKKARGENPEKKVEKVVTGSVTQRRKPLTSRVGETMIGDGAETVWQYVLFEVLIPAAKSTIADAVSQGINRLLYGDAPRANHRSGGYGYTNYNKVRGTSGSYEHGNREVSRRARTTHDFDDIILETRGEAEDVIDGLRDLIETYESATVADLYDLVGATGTFTDNRWGWYDLKNATVRPIRGGYLLNLPKTQPIDL